MISEKAITVSERVIDVGVDGIDIDVVNRWNNADGIENRNSGEIKT